MSDLNDEHSLYKPVKTINGIISRTKFNNATEDETVKFIRLIEKRPALYNYKLPIEDRKRSTVAKQWEQVGEIMKYTTSDCRRRWRNLRDTYHQYRLRKSNNATGTFENWKYTKNLEFLRSIHKCKPKKISSRKTKSKKFENVSTVVKSEAEAEAEDDSYSLEQNASSLGEIVDTGSEIEHCYEVNEVQLYDEEEEGDIGMVEDDKYFEEVDMEQSHVIEMNEIVADEDGRNHQEQTQQSQLICFEKTVTPTDETALDEVDAFFDFLKKKVRKLKASDLTDLQIEILNLFLSKEKTTIK